MTSTNWNALTADISNTPELEAQRELALSINSFESIMYLFHEITANEVEIIDCVDLSNPPLIIPVSALC